MKTSIFPCRERSLGEINQRMGYVHMIPNLRGVSQGMMEGTQERERSIKDLSRKNYLSKDPGEAARGGLEPDNPTGNHGRPRYLAVLDVRCGNGSGSGSGTVNGTKYNVAYAKHRA